MIAETMLIRMALRNVEKEVMASGKLNCNEDMGGVKGDFSTVCDFPPIPAVESLSAKWSTGERDALLCFCNVYARGKWNAKLQVAAE